jgi:hypothetical protein
MDIKDLYKEEQNEIKSELLDLYKDNEEVISYFQAIDKKVKSLIEIGENKKIKKNIKKLTKQLPILSSLKFMIYEKENETSVDWDNLTKYIINTMSLSEVENFYQKTKAKSNEIKSTNIKQNEIEEEVDALYLSIIKSNLEKLKIFEGIIRQIELANKENSLIFKKTLFLNIEHCILKKYDRITLILNSIDNLIKIFKAKKKNEMKNFDKSYGYSPDRIYAILKDFVEELENKKNRIIKDMTIDDFRNQSYLHRKFHIPIAQRDVDIEELAAYIDTFYFNKRSI